ncbi:hypothetical protein L218DRAFT_997259 [Marasmius fiardii PR-910]|nr:hypothetical protein L218DRAFT_997259 [Marasmius fiardii PR-910]
MENPKALKLLLIIISLSLLIRAQSCENYGFQNQSSCSCPTGFGGSTCSEIACGGTLFQGSQRPYTSTTSGFANITASGCQCQGGWSGTACNVCQSASACQSAFSSVTSGTPPSTGPAGISTNTTMVCNKTPRVWASSQMSCSVDNPTLKAIYPGASSLNIIRTTDPSLSPLPNVTSFGTSSTIYAQLLYDGEEQFYCRADSCTQSLDKSAAGSVNWDCNNLQCTCKSNATFCGRVPATNLTATINNLGGTVTIECGAIDTSSNRATCAFKQATIQQVFGSNGLALNGCSFGECVRQNVIDNNAGVTNSTSDDTGGHSSLSGGVIAGLAVVGGLLLIALLFLLFGLYTQRKARRAGYSSLDGGGVTVEWNNISYVIRGSQAWFKRKNAEAISNDKVVLDAVSGRVLPGQMMAILGPSGAGKTSLVEILAGKQKSGTMTGQVSFLSRTCGTKPRIGFVPQQDVLPPTLTAYEALLFAARLRLPDGVPDIEKQARVEQLMEKLGIAKLRNTRIGYGADASGSRSRGISGGEMRRVSIGLELIASPDILILDEPTSGLDSVSAWRVANVLRSIAHDPSNPTAVIASIHQPSSQLYQAFDTILVLAHGHALYYGPGGLSPIDYLANSNEGVPQYQQGYNVADYLLEVASDPPLGLLQHKNQFGNLESGHRHSDGDRSEAVDEKCVNGAGKEGSSLQLVNSGGKLVNSRYATTFLTQLQYLSGREWKILRRDKTLFLTHVAVASVLGVFCGGLYFKTDDSIAGFQSRVGCLFFLGALIAFSSLSALYNIVEIRPLFLRERSSQYYSPTAWLLSRFIFDVIPLRIVPTIIVSTITYWMAGLAHSAASYFKFLFILILYTLAMTLFNFLLGTLFHNGGIAILLSALTALYQMTYAGFFVHLNAIPPVLRWLQWLCPLKYCLEALAVNEVGSGLMIEDTLQGVPVNVSASLIMNLLFGFGSNNYYRDVLVLFAFIAGFAVGVIGVVWLKVRERR